MTNNLLRELAHLKESIDTQLTTGGHIAKRARSIIEYREARESNVKEVAPPGMEKTVKALKKKFPGGRAYAIAWSMYNKKKKNKKKKKIKENVTVVNHIGDIMMNNTRVALLMKNMFEPANVAPHADDVRHQVESLMSDKNSMGYLDDPKVREVQDSFFKACQDLKLECLNYAKEPTVERIQNIIRQCDNIIELNNRYLVMMQPINESNMDEVAPPGMEKTVKALKKKFPGGRAYAIAWSMYKKKKKKKTNETFVGIMEKKKKKGLWANIHAKRKRIKSGSGEKMRRPGSKGAPTDADFKAASKS